MGKFITPIWQQLKILHWCGFDVNLEFKNVWWFVVSKFNYLIWFNAKNVELKLKFHSDDKIRCFNWSFWTDLVKKNWIFKKSFGTKTQSLKHSLRAIGTLNCAYKAALKAALGHDQSYKGKDLYRINPNTATREKSFFVERKKNL